MGIFEIKKLASQFLHPIFVVLVLMALAWLLLAWSRRRQKSLLTESGDVMADYSVPKNKKRPGCLGMMFFFTGLMLLYWCSTGLVMKQMYFALESQYPPLQLDDQKVRELKPAYIVILGGSDRSDPELPVTLRNNGASTARLIEGIRVHQAFPGAKVVMTGGPMKEGGSSVASEMKKLGMLLGLEDSDIILEEEARDTKDNAKLLQSLLKGRRFILVTSAYHMPRAMGLFRGQGLNPIAASAEIKVWPDVHYEHEQLIPYAGNLTSVNTAMHEYLGLLWAFFRGQLGSAPWEAIEDSESTTEPEPEQESEPEPPPKSEQEESSPVADRAFFVRN